MRLRQTGPQEAPPQTPESIAAAKADNEAERAALAAQGITLPAIGPDTTKAGR